MQRRHSRHGTTAWQKTIASQSCAPPLPATPPLTTHRWPVIVAIIVGGLIAFSVVFCIARCICCGAECAICCCKCCTCCCGSSDSGHKGMKSENAPYQGYPPQPYSQQPYASNAPANPYAEARSFAPPPPPPQIDTQYQSHATPTFTPAPAFIPAPTVSPAPTFRPAPAPASEQPQYATFDAHKKPVNEDALPAMPSWNDARSVQVEVEEEAVPEKRGDVEMDRLNYNGSVPNTSTAGVAAGAMGAGMRASPGPGRSPVSPVQGTDAYGFPASYQDQYGRRGSPAQNQNISPNYGVNTGYAQDNYRQPSPAQNQNISPVYGANTGYAQDNYRQPSPAQSYSQYSQTSNAQDTLYDRRSPAQNQAYNIAQPSYNAPSERYNSPAPPSYHTTANPYSYAPAPTPTYNQPRSNTPGYGNGNAGDGGGVYDAVPSRTQTPSAYPGQQTYQAFQPQGQQYSGVTRKPLEGSLREV
jgi:hypothetical protein